MYFLVRRAEHKGQLMGLVTKALMKGPLPCTVMYLILFITCMELSSMNYSSVSTRIMVGWMFLGSL